MISFYFLSYVVVIDYFLNTQKFMMQKEFYTYNITQELKALDELVKELYGPDTKLFIVTDVMGTVAAQNNMIKNPDRVLDVFDLQTIPEYKTPGFGVVAQTDILLAMYMGQTRDKEGFFTKYMVMQTKKQIFKARNTVTEEAK